MSLKKKRVYIALIAYLIIGAPLYFYQRTSHDLIHTVSFQSPGITKEYSEIASHGVRAGEFSISGYLSQYLLFPLRISEQIYWLLAEPIGSSYAKYK